MQSKQCFKCGAVKAIVEFYKHPQMPDGHVNKCKECNKKDVQNNYRENKDAKREYERARFARPDRRAKKSEYDKRRALIKRKALRYVSAALRSGKLTRKPCEVCGDVKSEAHHADYLRPLDVRWLCFKHHREAHGQVVGGKQEKEDAIAAEEYNRDMKHKCAVDFWKRGRSVKSISNFLKIPESRVLETIRSIEFPESQPNGTHK